MVSFLRDVAFRYCGDSVSFSNVENVPFSILSGVNPARTFGPSMVTCMAGTCGEVVQSSYWIYYIAPFLASYVVAEVTEFIQMDLEADDEQPEEVAEKSSETGKDPEKGAAEQVADA